MALDRTWFNNLVDDDGSNTVGTVWNKTQISYLLNSVDSELGRVGGEGAGVYGSGAITIPHGTPGIVPASAWGIDFQTGGAFWSAALGQFVIPGGKPGMYHANVTLQWAGHATGLRVIYLYLDSALVSQAVAPGLDLLSNGPSQALSVYLNLVVGQTVQLWAFQNSGAPLTLLTTPNFVGPRFQLLRVG